MKKIQLKRDAQNRLCLTKVMKNLPSEFIAYEEDGKIILEPVVEASETETWLFKSENKEILKEVLEGIESAEKEPRIEWSSLKKSLKSLK